MIETHEKYQWRSTIEELKSEQLSEGVRGYLKKFFGGKSSGTPSPAPAAPPAPPSSNPIVAEKYIEQLNQILNKHQQALSAYISKLNLRGLKRKMEGELNFRALPERPSRPKPLPATPPITGKGTTPKPGKPGPIKTADDLPPNSIFESMSRDWKARASGLEQIMNDAYQDVLNFLLTIASDSGYTPKNSKDIKALLSEMKNFTILDKKTAHILRIKLIGFMITYRSLEGYLKFFQRTFQAQEKQEKIAAKKHIP